MKKLIFIVCMIIIFPMAFYVFLDSQKKAQSVVPAKSAQQIDFYHYFSGVLSGGISEMVAEVNKNHSDFVVSARAIDHEAFKSMIYTTLDKGTPPELFSYWAGAKVQYLVDQDKLAPIDDLWEEENFDDRFAASVVRSACTYNGHKYLLPINQFIVLFFYNTEVFMENGLTPPNSWKEFLMVCQKLKEAGITPLALGARERWPAQFWMDYLLLRTQPYEYRSRLMNGDAKYTDDEVKTVYKIWSQLLKDQFFNENANQLDWAEASQLVCDKKAAMTLMGSWAMQVFDNKEQGTKGGEQFDFFTFPVMDDKIPKVALGPIDGIVLSKKSRNHQFAKKTLLYFSEEEPQKKLSLGSGGLAPSLHVPLSFYSPFKKRMIEEIKSTKAWAFNYDLATPPEIAEIGMDSFNELIEFPDQYEKILINVEMEARTLFNELHTNGVK